MSMLDIATTERRSAEADALGGRMTHSISTPSGVDGAISALGHRGGKKLTVRIQMLDDSVTMFQVQAKALGKVLFEQVCRQLNLLEADYFGLEYQEMSTHTKYWLDLEKPINRQVGFSLMDPMLRFCVKFYTPDPAQLEEEYTRYLFCLQIKRDLASGSLQCNDNTAALMASYIVQASCGDFVPEDYPDHTYLSSYRFVPHQDDIMQRKIMENHKKHIGQTPAEADMNLLETARRCELYGMKMHAAKDIEGVPLNLAVAHMGITVFQNITRINTFSWAKIRKISFKRKRFLIKLHPEGYGYYKDTVEFYFEGRNECKNFWKKCVENHGFFRCITVQKQPRRKSRVLSRGSSFRYSGKTQKQMIEFVRENYVKRQNFQRSQSFRQGTFSSSSRCQSKSYVNSSISANPLLPVNTADWDCHNLNSDLTTTSTRREMATLDHQQNILTDSTSTQVTAAQVEILPAKNSSAEMQNKEASMMNHSALVQNPQLRNSHNNKTNMSANALEQDHMRQNTHNFGLHPLNHLYSNTNNSPRALAEFQAYATALPQQQQQQHHITNNSNNNIITHSVDLNSSIELELEQDQEEELEEEEDINSDLMTTLMKRENNIIMSIESSPILSLDRKLHLQESCSQTVTPIHYSSTKYSTSKRCINSNSTETETDNIIYTDIDVEQSDIMQTCQIENKISNRDNLNLNDKNDIYATINHETKLKSREKHLSDEYINRKIAQYVQTKYRNPLEMNNKQQEKYKNGISEKSSSNSSRYHNDLDHPSNFSLLSFITKSNQESSTLDERFSNFDNLITQSVDSQNSASGNKGDNQNHFFPKKSDYFGIDSLDSYDSHYITHHPFINMNGAESSTINNQVHYVNRENVLPLSSFVGNRISGISHTPPTKTYSEIIDYDMSSDYFQSVSQPEEEDEEGEENIYDQVQKETWLKSSSCKNFDDLALYFDCEHLYKEKILDKNFLSLNRIDSPITRFDDTGNANYTVRKNTNTSKKKCSPLRDAKRYSNSYPGSIYSTHDRRHSNHVDTCSQDDLSQDSYELLEKYGNDIIVVERSRSQDFQHSCSLDSGNYIPSEDEGTDSEHRYRSAMDVNCKSAADIMNEIWDSEDPRYLPREKMCVKSDGSFYKKIKEVLSHSSSPDSKKSHDSLYYTDSKKSRETSKSKSSIASGSPDLKDNIFVECIGRYEMPTTTGKKLKQFKKEQFESGQDVQSEFYHEVVVAKEKKNCKIYYEHPKVKSHDCLLTDSQNTTESSLNYDNREMYSTFPSNRSHKTSKVHSISLQNVEIEKNTKSYGVKSPLSAPSYLLNRENKEIQTNDSIDNTSTLKDSDLAYKSMFQLQHSSESTNIFSFDQDHIEDIQKYGTIDNKNAENTDYPLTPELISEFDKQQQKRLSSIKSNWRDELMAKTHFEEYNPSLNPNCTHTTVERTKSDPNSLANRSRLGLNSRRHVLMHQKSIDLTPADSSDEDYIYKQIPSAPPVCKSHGNFEMPKSFESNTNNDDTNYMKINDRRLNTTTKEEISYILHKRHIVNSSNSPQFEKKYSKPKSPKSPKHTKTKTFKYEAVPTAEIIDVLKNENEKSHKKFCISNPMETKSISKNDCLKQLDLSVIEKLNLKLSQIESDSATSSHTESLQHRKSKLERKEIDLVHNLRQELQANSRKNSKSRIITKSKISKPKKSKTRITSFSSDDESIDSDDVFGSAEAISNKLDFSPPQSRKEIEPILKIEQNRLISATWGRGQTMSSTEIEGSPPQCRRLAELENRYHTPKLDLPHINNSELRRISERSLSIPSSEDEHNVPLRRNDVCTNEYKITENIPSPIFEMAEFIRSNDQYDIDYTLTKNNLRQIDVKHAKSKIIEEMIDSSIIKRCKGHAPILFAHARLNLSEGSVSLQRQMATQQQIFTFDRRTKSLDAPVISLHKLPSMNAFSSKDDTVSFEEEAEILEEKPLHINTTANDDEPAGSVKSCEGFIPTQDFSTVECKGNPTKIIKLDEDEIELLEQIALIEKIALQSVKIKMKHKSKVSLKSGNHLILDIPKYGFNEWSPCNSGNSSRKSSPVISRAGSYENTSKDNSANNLSKPFDLFKSKSNSNRSRTRRTSADDIKSNDYKKKLGEKCRARSNENQKLNRDKSKSQEETEADIKARKERQQKLYESAIKQTKTLLSPVKDKLPVFPTSKDKISVKTEGDKIIIETEFKSKVEDHVLIAKSPRKLDTSLIQFSRSFDERRSPDKLDKANRSFEDRNKSFEESDKVSSIGNSSDGLLKAQPSCPDLKHKIEGAVVYNTKLSEKSSSLEKPAESHALASSSKAKSFDDKKKPEVKKLEAAKIVKRSSTGDRRMFSHQFQTQEDVDMQAVISERRSLEIYKRSLTSEETKDSECNASRKPSTTESIESYVSFDNSHSPGSKSPIPSHDSYPYRVPTIECEEASIEEDDNSTECHHLKVLQTDTNRLSLDRSKSDETGSWMTVECDEFVGSDTSDVDNPRPLEPERFILEAQTTLEDACPLEYSNCVTPTSDLSKMITPPFASPLVEIAIPELFNTQNLNTENLAEENLSIETPHSFTIREKRINLEDVKQECVSLGNMKEKSSIEDESSVSCSIARPLGISQEFGDREAKKSWEIKEKILKLELNTEICTFSGFNANTEKKGRLQTKKQSTPVLEKQNQIDLDINSEITQDSSEDEPNKTVKLFDCQFPLITETKVKSFESENSSNENDNSKEMPSSVDSKKLSHRDLRNAHEDSTKVYGVGLSNKPNLIKKSTGNESSLSSITDDALQNVEYSDYERCELSSYILHEVGNIMSKSTSSGSQKENDTFPEELNDFPTNIGYPALTCGIGINQSDIVGFSPTFTVGRTLSRISERSTASEKSSIEDDISKASTHSASLRDESVALTDHHPSFSSDSRSNTNLAYMSEADRRTSAEMPEIPCDSATGDKLSSIESINDPKSPTVVKGRFSVTQIIEGQSSGDKPTLLCLSNAGSQDSEDWPLPEIPFDHVPVKPVECLFTLPDLDKPVPKTFCFKLNDLHDVSSPPSKLSDPSVGDDSQAYLKHEFQAESDVEFDAFRDENKPDLLNIVNYEDTSYFMPPFLETNKEPSESSACLKSSFDPGSCLSSSFNASCTSLRKIKEKKQIRKEPSCTPVIMSQPTRSPSTKNIILDHEHFPNDCKTKFDLLGNERASISPSSLNASYEEINQSISGVSGLNEQKCLKSSLRMSSTSCRKFSHSSHSEEETSSIGTDVEGTVRMGYQQNKCTHSSHSEDTSIGLSISEWSGGTNTVKQYANLSGSDSISGASYVKSEKSHATKSSMSSINKSIESLNDQSASGSNKFSFDNGGSSEGFRYEVFSNSETEKASDTTSVTKSDDTTPTLTEIMHSLSEWSTSSSRTIVGYTTSDSNPGDNEQQASRKENVTFENRRRQTQHSAKNAFFEDKKDTLAKIHKGGKDCKYGVGNEEIRRKPCFREYEESRHPIQRSFSTEKNEKEYSTTQFQNKGAIEKKSSIKERENTDQHYTTFVEKLYSPNEKLSERYQSQDFSSIKTRNEQHPVLSDADNSKIGTTKKSMEGATADSTIKTVQSMPQRKNFIEMKFTLSKDSYDEDSIRNKKTRQSASFQEPIHFKPQEHSTFSNETITQSPKTLPSESNEIKDNPLAKAKGSENDAIPIKPARSKKRQRQNLNS